MTIGRRLARRRFLCAAGAFALPAAVPLACRAATAAYTLRMGVAEAATSVFGRAAVRLATSVERRSRGQLLIEVYPNGQLASQTEMINGLTSGVVDLTLTSSSLLVPLVPRCQVFDMPFLFKNIEAAARVLDGSIGDELLAEVETKGIAGLAWGISGFRELETTTKAIVVPEDMKGLRFRILAGQIFVATYQALGAIPVTIEISETFTALSQHTVDGVDFPLTSFTTSKLYTSAGVKHLANSNHLLSVEPLLGSKRKIDALPIPLQKILRAEGMAFIPYWRSLAAEETIADTQILKSNGVTFTEIQYPAFRKAVEPVYTAFQSRLGADLLDRVSRTANRT
jgi:TRAP-type transport system periplasmic protein